jgi:hypothetical protein
MASKTDLFKDLDFLTEQVSDRSLKVAFGLIAIWWAILIGDKHPPGLTTQMMLGPVALATLSILSDFCQYTVSYAASATLLHGLEESRTETFQYDRTAISYRARVAMFYGKQALAGAALIWFIGPIIGAIAQAPRGSGP